MKPYVLMFFVGLLVLGTGMALSTHTPAPIFIVFGGGCLIAALIKYLESK